MITHDAYFATLAAAPIKQGDVIVTRQILDIYGYSDDLTSKWTSGTQLMQVNVDAVGQFLGAATKKATVKLKGIIGGMGAGDTYQIHVGLKAPTDTVYDYISQGFFVIDHIDYDHAAGSTTVTMYDAMWRASNTPYATGFTYPCTVAVLAQQTASAMGVTLDPNFSTLPNASYTILTDLYATIANATLLTVVQELAAATGTTARMSDATLKFVPYAVQNETVDPSLAKNMTVGDFYGPVTTVVLGRVPQNDNILLSNKISNSPTITAVNTTTDLITIVGHGMTDGTLVQVTSTGTLPAPLTIYTNYFVYTGGATDTFKLMTNYADAIAGTNPVNLSTSGTGTMTLTPIPNKEIVINNIQILDNDRQTMLPPLYAEMLGIGWYAGKADTIGLPWHEVGDAIQLQPVSDKIPILISEVHYTFDGGISESIVSVIPDAQTVNYQTAGGILKTVYDTEIKVDKQANDIDSIVSQQITDQGITTQAFTDVYQAIDGVTTQVQSIGSGNLILNSVGYAQEPDGSLSFWTKSGSGTVTSYSSAASLSSGATSGNAIQLKGASGTQITQQITVANQTTYSLGFRVNKALGDGSATVTLSNAVSSFSIAIASGTKYVWDELKLEGLVPGSNTWNITIALTGTTTNIEITDLRVMAGNTLVAWDQSHSEILNTQVSLTTEGIRVTSNVHPGDYTVMTPIEFAGYSNVSGTTKKVFFVNRDTTEVQNLQVDGSTNFGNIIRAVPVASGDIAGLAFVGMVS